MSTYRTLQTTGPLPVPLEITTAGGQKIQSITVQYEAYVWGDGAVIRSTTVFDAAYENRSYDGQIDLPDDIPDAPQWFLDAVEAFLAEAGTS